MRNLRVDRLLAGTALAVVLAIAGSALAAPQDKSDSTASIKAESTAGTANKGSADAAVNVDSLVPMPESADVKPLTVKDLDPPKAAEPKATESKAAEPGAEEHKAAKPKAAGTRDTEPTAGETKKADEPKAESAAPKVTSTAPSAAVASKATGKELLNVPIATTVPTIDVPVAEKVRELVATKLDKYISRKPERAAVEVFYRDRGFTPLWVENGALDSRGKAVIARLKAADADGLDPKDYAAPAFPTGQADALAEAELNLTETVLTFARHLASGRIHYSHVSSNIEYTLPVPEPSDVLGKIATASNVATALDVFQPPHEGYRLLKAKLAEIRKTGEHAAARLDTGALLKIGMQDPRVPQLRERLGLEDDDSNTTFDAKLSAAVKAFQRRNDLKPTGHLNNSTVDALNGPKRDRTADIIVANMERWRWMPRDLGKFYVMVNLPDYSLKVVDHGKKVWSTKIVAGKPSMATPLISVPMQYLVVNPTWYVPQSIVYNEYLPALEQDPTVLERMGLVVERERDGTVSIRQPPGPGNALGRMKFAFPNKYSVYLHDTPDKGLFGREGRAYSHGCMRVEDPAKFGEVLASYALPNDHWTADRFKKMWGGSEDTLKFVHQPMVHLTYQTAYVDDSGKLVIRNDMYGLDKRILALLKSSEKEKEMAEIALPPKRENSYAIGRRPDNMRRAEQLVGNGGYYGGYNRGGGFNFFEQLFR